MSSVSIYQRNRFRKSGRKVLFLEIGQLHYARWLTLAIRLLAVCTREESPSGNLIKLVHYIVKVYAHSWFEIKSSSKLHESPRILFQNLSRIDQLSFEDLKTRGGVEDTRLEAKAKDTKKIRGQGQSFRGQTLSRPRTGMLEAKAKDQGHKRKCSPKKKKKK